MKDKMQRSFLKWAGNKYKILNQILPHIENGKRLIEPFAGSCVVSLNCNVNNLIIAEKNKDLINVYILLKKYKHKFIEECSHLFSPENNSSTSFYNLRKVFNNCEDYYKRATLFIYLNRHSYNGLCRYNADFKFNAPFGKYSKPRFPQNEMEYFISRSENMSFINNDFRVIMETALPGDVIYCDPPYIPISNTSKFTQYSGNTFSIDDHQDLACSAKELSQKGVKVIISNNDLEITRNLYKNADIKSFKVYRSISCKSSTRSHHQELLAIYNPK